jgi:cation diffusion facilitator family transporter
MPKEHFHNHDHIDTHSLHERRTRIVVMLTTITTVVEIATGYFSNSMALLAEGWHMTTHVFAIGLTWLAYVVTRKYAASERFSFQKEKLLSLSGFTSAIVLLGVAVFVFIESFGRILHPEAIQFSKAILVACIGLGVNLLSALLLYHKHEHSDNNIRAAYIHVLADGFTGLVAILSLIGGRYFHTYSLDALSGIIGSLVISAWALSLMKSSAKVLVDFKGK